MRRFTHSPAVLLLSAWLLLCVGSPAIAQRDTSAFPKNIIFFIGDGMGTAQVSALRLTHPLTNFDRFSIAGFSVTRSLSNLVTESAAGATALATGQRTANERVSVTPDGKPLVSLLETAKASGMRTGVVVTCSITHATPAAFLAHVSNRKKQHDIAAQIAAGSTDVLVGGGWEWFLPKDKGGTRTDGRDLIEALMDRDYSYRAAIDRPDSTTHKLCMLLASDALPPAGKRKYSLSDLVRIALASLASRENGFVLVVEGSQIDWAGHDNNFLQLLAEMEDLDGAIGTALDFASRDGSTLVVATADHETGGLTLTGTHPEGRDISGSWAGKNHTATMVPVFAAGPGSTRFGGIHDNEQIGRILQYFLPELRKKK